MLDYAIMLTKVVPGEPTGMISDLMEDWGFQSERDAMKAFDAIELTNVYIRKELWVKNTDSKIKKLIKEVRYKE